MRSCSFPDCKQEVQDDYPLQVCQEHRTKVPDDAIAPMSVESLKEVLGITIKADDTNKIITFLGMLTAYTEDSQINISFRAPSSTGKSYIPLEIASLFPQEDVIEIAYSSPTAFFHDRGEWDDEKSCLRINLERKVLVFVDMPHDDLLHRLRPLLSHDRKELVFKITDKREKKGLRTKNVILRGYPSVIFCTSSLRMDEQESTRNILLSPETNQEKLRAAFKLKVEKEANPQKFKEWLQGDPRRMLLKARIERIRNAGIESIVIPDTQEIMDRFLSRKLKPRDTRDVGRLTSLIKASALLNLWHRKKDEFRNLLCSEEDIETGIALWKEIERSQELGIPPYILRLFDEIIRPLGAVIERKSIVGKHYEVYGKPLQDWQLRREILPILESAGLVYQEPDPEDRRKMLVHVVTPPSSSQYPENNREDGGGVTSPSTPPPGSLYSFTQGNGEQKGGVVCYRHSDRVAIKSVTDPYAPEKFVLLCSECSEEGSGGVRNG